MKTGNIQKVLKINRLCKNTLNALWKIIERGMERLQIARYLYSLAKVVWVHPHIPESCYTEHITLYVIDHFVIVVNDNGTIMNFPITQQKLWSATLRKLQQTFLFLQILLMKICSGFISSHLIIIDENTQPLTLSTFRDLYSHYCASKLSSNA